jgi:hypothetical protein
LISPVNVEMKANVSETDPASFIRLDTTLPRLIDQEDFIVFILREILSLAEYM